MGEIQSPGDLPMKKNRSKAEIVYAALKEEILKGAYSPRERLVERELTEKFGMSKTPIREALSRLKEDGLVGGTLYQGMYVVRLLPSDALEIYEIREILEGLVARKVAQRITPELTRKLKDLLSLASRYAKTNEVEYFRLNLEFHRILKKACGNQRLSEMLERVYNQNQALLSTSLNIPKRGPRMSLNEHKGIVAAIVKKKPGMAEEMAREHIRNTYRALQDWCRKNQL